MNSGHFDIMLKGRKRWTKLKVNTDLSYNDAADTSDGRVSRDVAYKRAIDELKERRALDFYRDYRIRETVNQFKQKI